ncbi:MAG: hypothetical protein AAGG38_02040 [Planctomycetota bacterium]
MQPFDRIGTFRGVIEKSAVDESKNGWPRFIAAIRVDEYYDPTGELTEDGEPGYIPWGQYEMGGTGYFTLYGKSGATATCAAIMALLDWNGYDFEALANADLEDKRVLIRVVEDTYPQAKSPFKIDWIEDPDAPPTRELKSLDSNGLKALTVKFKGQAPGPVAKPATAPAKPPAASKPKGAAKPKAESGAPSGGGGGGGGEGKPQAPAKPATPTPSTTKNSTPASPASSPADDAPAPVANSDEAWASVYASKPDALADDALAELWTEAVSFVSGGDPSKELTPEQWTQVRDDVLRDIVNQTAPGNAAAA